MIDHSGFLGVVTLKSLNRVLPRLNLISATFSYLVICLYYHAIACNLTINLGN